MSKFSIRINARGSQGNVFAIIGNASSLMRELKVPREEIVALQDKCFASESYEEAVEYVREYFPVDL